MMEPILTPGKNCMGFEGMDAGGVLVDGRNYYRAFCQAAEAAESCIMLSGWQFDSRVPLVRGKDAEGLKGSPRFLPFLERLCAEKPELNIYILAWDFTTVFLPDHELIQAWTFNWSTNERLHFLFDGRHAVAASHHQKFVVIDGSLVFVGGLDICGRHWDDRLHMAENPLRREDSVDYEPYHDIQAFMTGPVAGTFTGMFRDRWVAAGGSDITRPRFRRIHNIPFEYDREVAADIVAISRTAAKTASPQQDALTEIRNLYADAISAAEEIIYIENQFFTSWQIYEALVHRISADDRRKPDVIILLPRSFNAFFEAATLGKLQERMLSSLAEAAKEHGCPLGIYNMATRGADGSEVQVYVHSKVMVVDDRFLTVGSANLTNRSMSLDTEINVSWEADPSRQAELARSIRRVRENLLSEHLGSRFEPHEALRLGPVSYLDGAARRSGCRLRKHDMDAMYGNYKMLKDMAPDELSFDPAEPLINKGVLEPIFSEESILISVSNAEAVEDAGNATTPAKEAEVEAFYKTRKDLITFERAAIASMAISVLAWLLFRSC
jgi:phospholipase D1/2